MKSKSTDKLSRTPTGDIFIDKTSRQSVVTQECDVRISHLFPRFHINLQQGCQTYPSPTIAFHFNPRYEGGNRVIVMNSWMGSWGSEQRVASGRNLAPGASFVLIIRRQPAHFEVLVNGSRITTFNHRIMADMVDSVAIDGDVYVHKVVAI